MQRARAVRRPQRCCHHLTGTSAQCTARASTNRTAVEPRSRSAHRRRADRMNHRSGRRRTLKCYLKSSAVSTLLTVDITESDRVELDAGTVHGSNSLFAQPLIVDKPVVEISATI